MRYAATLPLSLQAKNANKEALLSFPWDKKPPTKKAAPLTKKTIDGLLSQYKFLNKRQWN